MLPLEKAVYHNKDSAQPKFKTLIFKNLVCHPGILGRWQDTPLAYADPLCSSSVMSLEAHLEIFYLHFILEKNIQIWCSVDFSVQGL